MAGKLAAGSASGRRARNWPPWNRSPDGTTWTLSRWLLHLGAGAGEWNEALPGVGGEPGRTTVTNSSGDVAPSPGGAYRRTCHRPGRKRVTDPPDPGCGCCEASAVGFSLPGEEPLKARAQKVAAAAEGAGQQTLSLQPGTVLGGTGGMGLQGVRVPLPDRPARPRLLNAPLTGRDPLKTQQILHRQPQRPGNAVTVRADGTGPSACNACCTTVRLRPVRATRSVFSRTLASPDSSLLRSSGRAESQSRIRCRCMTGPFVVHLLALGW